MAQKMIDRSVIKLWLLCLSLGVSSWVQAFPELVRHGYANCITCHQSPSGGGLLTPYGRSLSAKILSTWNREGEEQFLYGVVKPPEWLTLGGDIRTLQLYQNRVSRKSAEFIFMQADAEAGATMGKVSLVATAGVDHAGDPISRRHYVNYRPTDEISFRAGRFLPAFGINTENHTLATKRGLGRDQSTETYNVEAAYITTNYDVFLTGIFGRPDNTQLGAETGISLSSSVFVGNRYKMGVSYLFGSRATASRHLAGPYFILGFSPHFFLLADSAIQWFSPKNSGGPSTTGFVDNLRLDYEPLQGLHVYLIQEYAKADFSSTRSVRDAYGIGVQWFPRSHIEINTLYQKQRIGGNGAPFADFVFTMLHYYL
jgi:hypothetical protein